MRAWLSLIGVLLIPAFSGVAGEPVGLARSIDTSLAAHFAANGIVPAPLIDDALFLRRISLDLVGRIPTPEEVTAYVEDAHPEKQEVTIDRLLRSSEHAHHFARTWRTLLVPEADNDRQLRYLLPGFEAWLRNCRQDQVGFDEIVRGLLTVPITGTRERPQLVLTDLKKPNPVAFIAAKNADAAALASSTTRLFLGIRLECAQCHDHPFGQWTQRQFWNQAAFFAGIERKGKGAFAPVLEDLNRRTIPIMDKATTVPVLFLDGQNPDVVDGQTSRIALAQWVTAPNNPYFSRAVVNRIWGELMGIGLVDPVDDMHSTNLASHPELLDQLAEEFTESKFDLDLLYKAICLSDTYQRTSRLTDPSQQDATAFSRRTIKPMTGEQFADSLLLAIEDQSIGTGPARQENGSYRRLVELFDSQGGTSDPETSVAQTLTLLNGRLLNRAVSPDQVGRLQSILHAPDLTDTERVQQLYLATYSRYPTSDELSESLTFISAEGPNEKPRRLGDVFWALLNSAEFRWNH